ncbi:hypothetical protein SAMN05444920_106199 [Nonomuraea solani]|uniref:Uncharacterized protein n=1 Tax=Nonomuraea solani TaxID=1144553 RepID=A0A1H6DU00_9ACTN|nr:hypothetical protein SAMN05444920_106199 [Nonomuraea solani]
MRAAITSVIVLAVALFAVVVAQAASYAATAVEYALIF